MLYTDFYLQMKSSVAVDVRKGLLVELGSGGGFIKEIIPGVVTSDVLDLPEVDKRFSVLDMPFDNGVIDAFFMLDVFHHVKDSYGFLKEMDRCLKAAGRIVMIEPANTLWGRFIQKWIHREDFDPDGGWGFEEGGPLSGANAALPWIVFRRDRERFEKEFPGLRVRRFVNHNPLRYILSGGVSFIQVVPTFSYSMIKALEAALTPINDYIGIFSTIELVKVG